jgi:hypothetical protein
MKKIVIICSIAFSAFGFAQESSENSFLYEECSSTFSEEDTFPGNPGDPNVAPIDRYIPVLFTAALVLMVFATKGRKLLNYF